MSSVRSSNRESINWIDWIEESLSKKHIKYYDYKYFKDIKEIGSGNFGKVHRATWKNSCQYLALKSFYNLDIITIKELVHEVIINKCHKKTLLNLLKINFIILF